MYPIELIRWECRMDGNRMISKLRLESRWTGSAFDDDDSTRRYHLANRALQAEPVSPVPGEASTPPEMVMAQNVVCPERLANVACALQRGHLGQHRDRQTGYQWSTLDLQAPPVSSSRQEPREPMVIRAEGVAFTRTNVRRVTYTNEPSDVLRKEGCNASAEAVRSLCDSHEALRQQLAEKCRTIEIQEGAMDREWKYAKALEAQCATLNADLAALRVADQSIIDQQTAEFYKLRAENTALHQQVLRIRDDTFETAIAIARVTLRTALDDLAKRRMIDALEAARSNQTHADLGARPEIKLAIDRLKEKVARLNLRDLKLWYVGGTGPDAPSLEELAQEVLDILDADEHGNHVDISEKLK